MYMSNEWSSINIFDIKTMIPNPLILIITKQDSNRLSLIKDLIEKLNYRI